ncbi:MAG: hypothetical protein WC796_05630 [Candidatus Pacearchaeota archaeon]|jgi:hypothetical protein
MSTLKKVHLRVVTGYAPKTDFFETRRIVQKYLMGTGEGKLDTKCPVELVEISQSSSQYERYQSTFLTLSGLSRQCFEAHTPDLAAFEAHSDAVIRINRPVIN